MLPFDLALALVAAPPLSPSGGLTSRPARAPGYCGANEWVDPSPDPQLSWASLPSGVLDAPFAAPRGGLMALPHTGIRQAEAGDPSPSVATQQHIPGVLPGAGAHRSTIGDLVRSSVLVFQRAAPCGARGEKSNAWTNALHRVRFLRFGRPCSEFTRISAIRWERRHPFHKASQKPLGARHPNAGVECAWRNAAMPAHARSCRVGRCAARGGAPAPHVRGTPSPGVFHKPCRSACRGACARPGGEFHGPAPACACARSRTRRSRHLAPGPLPRTRRSHGPVARSRPLSGSPPAAGRARASCCRACGGSRRRAPRPGPGVPGSAAARA